MTQPLIGIIGASNATPQGCTAAEEVGRLLAENGCAMVCGGLDGIMTAAARGCRAAGGTVLGILPGPDTADANPHVSFAVATNMGHARNVIIAHTAQALIAIEGEFGTLSEIAIALKLGKTVIGLSCPHQVAGLTEATTPFEAVKMALAQLPGANV